MFHRLSIVGLRLGSQSYEIAIGPSSLGEGGVGELTTVLRSLRPVLTERYDFNHGIKCY